VLFQVTIEKAEDGWLVAECPSLPGCVSQGKTEEEAISNIKEAIEAWLWAENIKVSEEAKKRNIEPILVSV
jgi:predicted RNase H-like HicB family nuclease